MAPIFRADRHQYVTNTVFSVSCSLYRTCLGDENLLAHLRCHNKVQLHSKSDSLKKNSKVLKVHTKENLLERKEEVRWFNLKNPIFAFI